MARRLLSMYEYWLGWSAGLRNTSVPPAYEEVLETTACRIDGPNLSVREFIDHVAHQTAQLPELAADGTHEHPITLTFELKLDIETRSLNATAALGRSFGASWLSGETSSSSASGSRNDASSLSSPKPSLAPFFQSPPKPLERGTCKEQE